MTSLQELDGRTEVRRGPAALVELGERLDDLHQVTGCPVTARRPWQQTWIDHYGNDPLVVTVSGPAGELRAAAALAVRPGALARVVPVGDGLSDEVRLPARTTADADVLARGVVEALRSLGRPWLLVLRHLDATEPAVQALCRQLRWAKVTPGDVSPRLVLHPDKPLREHVSRNHHQQVRRMRNRLARDGRVVETAHLMTAGDVASVWPEVERLCRARDLQLRGVTSLDDPRAAGFFRDAVALLASRDEVCLTTLRLDGRLAAYVLAFRDGAARRMWNCRLDPELHEYGVGRIANDAALGHALADPSCVLYDWMRGEEPYKASMSDHSYRAVDLTACSSRALWATLSVSAALRQRLRAARDGGSASAGWVRAAQPALQWLDPTR